MFSAKIGWNWLQKCETQTDRRQPRIMISDQCQLNTIYIW